MHSLTIGDNEDITSLNPHLSVATTVGNLSQLTMAYLVRYDAHDRPIPELATTVPTRANGLISADGLTITWRLRHNVRWSDGAPFSADDLVFSTQIINNARNNEVSRSGFDLIRKVDEPDPHTVVYHLKKPYSSFLPTFFASGPNPCLLPKHLLSKLPDINHADYNALPVGIGPFRYVKWVRGDRVELAENPLYWRGRPKLDRITYKFLPDRNTLLTQMQTGEIDLWPYAGTAYFERLNTLRGVSVIVQPGYHYNHIDFNNSRPLFRHHAVREALRYAIDRETIKNKISHGLGFVTDTEIPPSSPLSTKILVTPFSIAKANAVLDADGWKRGEDGIRAKDGLRLEFTFALPSGLADADSTVELIRSTWERIGARIDVRHYPSAMMFASYEDKGLIERGNFDVVYFSWQLTPDGDLSAAHACDQVPPAGENDLHYCNPRTDALLRQAETVYGEDARRPILAAIQRQIIADVPEIVTAIQPDVFAYNSNLTGWKPNGITAFDDMLNVDI
jgi:peptide/nickel transport system substrate-binding protein